MTNRKFHRPVSPGGKSHHRRLSRRPMLGAADDDATAGAAGHTGPTSRAGTSPAPFTSWWTALGARVFGGSLDARLAAGAVLEPRGLLGARAVIVTSPTMRRLLSESWLGLLAQAHEPPRRWDARVPIPRRRILAAEGLIRDVADALCAPVVSARGVALACALLSDGSGPVYNEWSTKGLEVALREVRQRLDPLSLWEKAPN